MPNSRHVRSGGTVDAHHGVIILLCVASLTLWNAPASGLRTMHEVDGLASIVNGTE